MKKILITILIFILLFAITPNAAKIDGEEIESTLINGVTMAPLFSIAEKMELDYSANEGAYSVKSKGENYIKLSFERGKEGIAHLTVCSEGMMTKSEDINLPEKSTYIDGKLYVPFRTVLEAFEARVYWTEEEGAWAYRTDYGREIMIRTDGKVRQALPYPEEFEGIVLLDDNFLYIKNGWFVKKNLNTGEEAVLCKVGIPHKTKDKLFVMAQDELFSIDIESGEYVIIAKGVSMVGYTADDYAWCETDKGTFIYDKEGALISEITGRFDNSWDYFGTKVYYLDKMNAMYRANPDGTNEEFLIKTALYPKWIDKYIYYTDQSGSYRRFNVETKEDIMVYGLNLEHIFTLSDKYILNFYGDNGKCGMYISNPDGTDFAPYGSEGVIAGITPALYKDGIVTVNHVDKKLYYITKDEAIALTDDKIESLVGVYDGFVYYTIK